MTVSAYLSAKGEKSMEYGNSSTNSGISYVKKQCDSNQLFKQWKSCQLCWLEAASCSTTPDHVSN